MLKEMLSRRNEEPFFLITVLLLIIIAVYNWVIALLALILIIGAYVLTRKIRTSAIGKSVSFSTPFPKASTRRRLTPCRICPSA